MPVISPVEPLDPAELGPLVPYAVESPPGEDAPADPMPCRRDVPARPSMPWRTRVRAHLEDLLPERRPMEAFVATPRLRVRLNEANVAALDRQLPKLQGVGFRQTIGALNWRSIRAGGLLYELTNGTPSVWLYPHASMTASWGTLFDARPMDVTVALSFSDWVHRARILIHEIEGHGTNEYGRNLPGDQHVADRFSILSRQPYAGSNPFLAAQWPGFCAYGMSLTTDRPGWQRIAGPPIWRD